MVVHGGTRDRGHMYTEMHIGSFVILTAFIINHLTMMEVPCAGMMIKIYLRLKIGSELHWPRAVSTVVLAMVNMWILSAKS
jgi:hypothetical protein